MDECKCDVRNAVALLDLRSEDYSMGKKQLSNRTRSSRVFEDSLRLPLSISANDISFVHHRDDARGVKEDGECSLRTADAEMIEDPEGRGDTSSGTAPIRKRY